MCAPRGEDHVTGLIGGPLAGHQGRSVTVTRGETAAQLRPRTTQDQTDLQAGWPLGRSPHTAPAAPIGQGHAAARMQHDDRPAVPGHRMGSGAIEGLGLRISAPAHRVIKLLSCQLF